MRRFLFGLLFLHLSSCDVLWGGFANLNADVCENGGTKCMPGFACNAATLRCERLPSPTLSAVSPALASNLGGSPIDILGHNFQAGATVRFDGVPATQTTFVSATQLTATLPPSQRGYGLLTVTVQNPDEQQASLEKAFAYYASQPFQSVPSQCSSGFRPAANLLADFNMDGKLDLAITSPPTNSVVVQLGNGMGGFGALTPFPVGSTPKGFATGDFNSDTKLDLVVANQGSDNISVLLGDGRGGFAPAQNIAVGSQPVAVGVGDWDGDGVVDLIVSLLGDNAFKILHGNGQGGFGIVATRSPILSCRASSSFAVGNFTGGSKPDIAADCGRAPSANSAELFRNDGSGGFAGVGRINFIASQSWIAAGDLTNDGLPDLVITADGEARALINTGANFGNWLIRGINVGPNPVFVTTADMDNNGKLDLVIVDQSVDNIRVVPGNGDGTFGVRNTLPVGQSPIAAAVGDLNGDSKLDIVVSNQGSSNTTVLLGDGAGAFTPVPLGNPALSSPQSLAVADFDNDGPLDLAVANFDGSNLTLLSGDGRGGFKKSTSFAGGDSQVAVVSGDFNADKRLDLAIANQALSSTKGCVNVLLGTGPGTFALPQPTCTLNGALTSLVAADFDGDRKLDVAVGNGNNNGISLLIGAGNGIFGTIVNTIPAGMRPSFVVAGDFNGDTSQDLIVANQLDNNVSVLAGNGLGGFAAPAATSTGLSPWSVVTADFNSDQKADLAVANSADGSVSILLGDGLGGFLASPGTPSVGAYPVALAAGDLNGDGRPDLAVANQLSNTISVLFGLGTGQFAPAVNVVYGCGPNAIQVGDFDGDSKLDLAIVNLSDNNASVSRNLAQ